jgi:hypothetical protein
MTDTDGVREAMMLQITSGLEGGFGDEFAELAARALQPDVIWTEAAYKEAMNFEASIIVRLLYLCAMAMDTDPREVWRAVAREELLHRPSP